PAKVPYLHADESLLAAWRSKMPARDQRLNVGLSWSGRLTHRNNRNRSVPPELLVEFAAVKEARFFSLQKSEQKFSVPAELNLIHWTDEVHDFGDSAALLGNLDLLITVDTAPAHLAGALGMEVWLLLAYSADWRWLRSRAGSPW